MKGLQSCVKKGTVG